MPEERAWFEADRRLREKLTIRDIGIWSHYVGDASQPLHVSVHYNGWGDFPNPKDFTTKHIHAHFEGEFVKRNLSRSAVAEDLPKTSIGSADNPEHDQGVQDGSCATAPASNFVPAHQP